MNDGPASNAKWLYNSPIHSDVEAKLRRFLVELGNADKILGIQVCAYKDGQVIIDTAAGVLAKEDPRPVQPDSLFPVFSVTKGITSGMVHWLADKGELKLDENVANIWSEFGTNGKDQIKANHILNHTSGLHNALAGVSEEDPTLFCDFDECLKRIAMVAPETEPGREQLYHYLSYGWLCGGIIEAVSWPEISISFVQLPEKLANIELSNMISDGVASDAKWVYDSPIYSDVEAKLRSFLVKLGNEDKILGIQVSAYKDGQVIIDTAAGVLGKDDPRPVQPSSLFPLFSVTKGVTAGMVHWLADKGKLKLDENVANIWPEFGTNGKEQVKVHHVLNHTSGLHNALAGISEDDHTLLCDFDECLIRIAMVAPETEPGHEQLYHYLSYGWLCGGIIERASGKKFQDVLEEAFIRPLNLDGELYIGIPAGAETRAATITVDTNEPKKANQQGETKKTGSAAMKFPSSLTPKVVAGFFPLINGLNVRRAIMPAFNLHSSARALARFYAALVDADTEIFTNTKAKLHDAFLGSGDYEDLIIQNGQFGLGFIRLKATDGSVIGFGHAGVGGATAYCDINNRFAISVTLNLASSGALTGEIIRFICSELDLPVPEDYAESRDFTRNPKIN